MFAMKLAEIGHSKQKLTTPCKGNEMATIISEQGFKDFLGKYLNEEMVKAAEPLLQEALKKIELEMRKSIAKNIIAFMASDYDMQIDKNRIMIMLGRDKIHD